MMFRKSAGACTRCTRANAFPGVTYRHIKEIKCTVIVSILKVDEMIVPLFSLIFYLLVPKFWDLSQVLFGRKFPKAAIVERWKLPRINSPQFTDNSKKMKQRGDQKFVCLIWGSYFFHRSSLRSREALVTCCRFAFLHDARWHQEKPSEFSFGKRWKFQ